MVTGSCYLLEACGKRIIIDCGLRQGRDDNDYPNDILSFDPRTIDAVVVTHAHIDHSGRIPLLKARGFSGSIYATRLTGELLQIMLPDSAFIQQSEAKYENRKGKRAGKVPVEPLYTIEDVNEALKDLISMNYGEKQTIFNGIVLSFTDAGHLLGSASAELLLTEDGISKKIVFSGDIGNLNQPIVRDPQLIPSADYVVMESTYGDEDHKPVESYTETLAELIDDTFRGGGNVIIPSFAVGRTQELLYFIREIKERGLVKSFPDFPVYVDSPLANEATRIYSGNLDGYVDTDAEEILRGGGEMFSFAGLRLSMTTDDSKALNEDDTPKVIISASGMCEAGRIRHHLKHNLWRPECTIIFVGYQAEGTLGRLLTDGIKKVKLFGEQINVAARIVKLNGMSAHADRSGLIRWISAYNPRPANVFVVHGEAEVSEGFTDLLNSMGIKAHTPYMDEVYDLAADRIIQEGTPPMPSGTAAARSATIYEKLLAAGKTLLKVIEQNKGGSNRDLRSFTEQIQALIDKWER